MLLTPIHIDLSAGSNVAEARIASNERAASRFGGHNPKTVAAGVFLSRSPQRGVGRISRYMAFRIVQPWGPDKARKSTVISEHATAADAFRTIDRLASEMVRTGAPSDGVELLVLDANYRLVRRSDAH